MRLIKMLSLAMVVAAAAMAIVGAGTASAVLCKVKEPTCAAGNQYPVPTNVLVFSKNTKLVAGITVECESHATLKHEGVKEGKLFGTIVLLDWKNCKGCTEVTTTTNGTFTDEATGEGNGKLFPKGVVVLLKNCPFGIECTAKSNTETALNLDGGTINGTALGLANTKVSVEGGGGLCGSTGTWKAETPYSVLSVNGSESGSIFEE